MNGTEANRAGGQGAGRTDAGLRSEVRVGPRAIEVRVVGEIDLANVDEFRALLWAQPANPAILRLDLSGVDLLSAAAVRALIGVHLRTRSRGGQLILSNPKPHVRQVLRATRINRVIPIVDSGSRPEPAAGGAGPVNRSRRQCRPPRR